MHLGAHLQNSRSTHLEMAPRWAEMQPFHAATSTRQAQERAGVQEPASGAHSPLQQGEARPRLAIAAVDTRCFTRQV